PPVFLHPRGGVCRLVLSGLSALELLFGAVLLRGAAHVAGSAVFLAHRLAHPRAAVRVPGLAGGRAGAPPDAAAAAKEQAKR
ncbi:hypothetical protein, partial [Arthrobacter sp. MAHUQ-56]